MPNKLSGFLTGEVSLVDRGANLKPRFSVTKAEEPMDPIQAVLQTKAEGEDAFVDTLKAKGLEQKAIDAAVAQFRLQAGFKDLLGNGVAIESLKAAGIEVPTEPVTPTEPKPTEPTLTEKDLATLPESVRKQLAQVDVVLKQNETLQETLKQERTERCKAEFVTKAKEQFTHVPGTSEEIGQTLFDAYEVSKEFGEKIEKQLSASQDALKSSALLHRAGHAGTGTGGDDAWAEIERKAEAMVQKSMGTGAEVTKEKAVGMYLKTAEGKRAYEAYLSENPRQVH